MAITSWGFDGPITEAAWSKMMILASTAQYTVGASLNAFRVTAVANADRTVSVAPGDAYGSGIYNVSDSAVTLQHDTVASGSRYDLVVIRRDWANNTTTLAIVKGTASSIGAYALRYQNTGVLDDQPLALVRIDAGVQTVAAIYDIRAFASNAGIVSAHDHVRNYLSRPGTTVRVGGKVWQLGLDVTGSSPQWYGFESDPDKRSWFGYRSTVDTWGGNTNGDMAATTITDAPAGTYLLDGYANVRPGSDGQSGGSAFLLRYLTGTGILVRNLEFRTDRPNGYFTGANAPAVGFYHPGGTLIVRLQARCAQACTVSYAGLSVNYLGPSQS